MRKIFYYLIAICFCSSVGCEKGMEEEQRLDADRIMSDIKLVYEYPITPGMTAWDTLSERQRIEACNIPEAVLAGLRTHDLIEVILAYPLMDVFYNSSSVSFGYLRLVGNFNAILELSQHEHVEARLIDAYEARIAKIDELQRGHSERAKYEFVKEISAIELLSSQVNSASFGLGGALVDVDNRKKLIKALLAGYDAKTAQPQYFTKLSLNTNIYARMRALIGLTAFTSPIVNADALQFSDREVEAIDRLSREFIR